MPLLPSLFGPKFGSRRFATWVTTGLYRFLGRKGSHTKDETLSSMDLLELGDE